MIEEKKGADMSKLFTKSAFKVALECPTQLYYYYDKDYANQNHQDEFLKSLAEGGFQVGELAKIYCGVDEGCDLGDLHGYDLPAERTRELLQRERVTIAEAAFRFGNLFIRVDILRKDGNRIDLIEVKAKSWEPAKEFIKDGNHGITVHSNIRMYVYDVAFQRYVLENALREMGIDATVHAYLMLADKSKVADVDGINQRFKIEKNGDRTYVSLSEDAAKLKDCQHEHILTEFDVDDVCKMIIAGETSERQQLMGGQGFVEFVNEKAAWYCNHQRHYCELTTACFRCPFYKTSESRPEDKDGFEECWMEKAKFCPEDFQRPLIEELWGGGNARLRGNLLRQGKYFLDAITADDIGTPSNPPNRPGLDHCQRKIVQIGMTTGRQEMLGELCGSIRPDGAYLDVDGLRNEMANWRFPLHMIDFETTSVALPFFAGMRPYEQVAFQFSHHIIEKDDSGYRIRHAGQYINTEQGKFPNFEFVRQLKKAVGDEGTIFRYWTHENTVLNDIRVQLEKSSEADKDELIEFIMSITDEAERSMVDIAKSVLKYYYNPMMKGSNSIKAVLPAILNSSELIKSKYSKPVYGTPEMPSLNLENKVWIEYEEDGKTVINPYKLLPSVSSYIDFQDDALDALGDEEREMYVVNGGAALAAYAKLQFSDTQMSAALEKALLCYCELDTLAMVFIWEYFNDMCNKK
jgi:hypothetical protein